MKIDVTIVNAFTHSGEGGNPAGVVLDASKLTEQQMQETAYKVGASETAFILPSTYATQQLRFFTPTTEVSLCGHATVASWSLMKQRGIHSVGTYTQSTKAGILPIEIEESGKIFIEMPEGKVGAYFDPNLAIKGLGLKEADLDSTLLPRFIDQDLMICLKSESTLNAIKPDFDFLKNLSAKHGFYDFHVFALANDSEVFAKVRNFCPVLGIPEDAATGTTNATFLTYLKDLGKLPKQTIYTIEQGKAMGKPSNIYGKFVGRRVWIGGEAAESNEVTIQID